MSKYRSYVFLHFEHIPIISMLLSFYEANFYECNFLRFNDHGGLLLLKLCFDVVRHVSTFFDRSSQEIASGL